MGAITAESLARRQDVSVACARARLVAARRDGQLAQRRPLTGHPALYAITRRGLALAGRRGLGPCCVTASNAGHLIACAEVAAALERRYADSRVWGERELRRAEQERAAPLASALLGRDREGAPLLHRPDLALWLGEVDCRPPVAVEVELSLKAPGRLAAICRAWARCRVVAGVLYLVSPPVKCALERAIAREGAQKRVVVASLQTLL